jgi:hypothetical protein
MEYRSLCATATHCCRKNTKNVSGGWARSSESWRGLSASSDGTTKIASGGHRPGWKPGSPDLEAMVGAAYSGLPGANGWKPGAFSRTMDGQVSSPGQWFEARSLSPDNGWKYQPSPGQYFLRWKFVLLTSLQAPYLQECGLKKLVEVFRMPKVQCGSFLHFRERPGTLAEVSPVLPPSQW